MAKAKKRKVSKRACPKGKIRVGRNCLRKMGRYIAKRCKSGLVLQSGPNRGKCPSAAAVAARKHRRLTKSRRRAGSAASAAAERAEQNRMGSIRATTRRR